MQKIALIILIISLNIQFAYSQWSSQNSGVNTDLKSVHFRSNSSTGYVCGANGVIRITTNSGANWSGLTSGTNNSLNSIFFVDGQTGFASGDNGLILKTTNSGSSWVSKTTNTNEIINDVYFVNSSNGVFVANNGKLGRTANSGESWDIRATNISNNLNGVYFADLSNVYAVGSNGTIIKSTDAGSSWNTLTSGVTNNLTSVFFTSTSNGYAVGSAGRIIRTTNGGANWSSISSGVTQDLFDITFSSDGSKGYITGSNGIILYSSNGGLNWSTQTSNVNNSLQGLSFSSQNTGYIVGNSGLILNTTNGGGTQPIITLSSPDGGEQWLAGTTRNITWTSANVSNIVIQYSTNSGSDWNILDTVVASDNSYSWIIPNNISTNNAIVRLTDLAQSGASDQSAALFSILDYILTLTSPIGGEVWNTGSVQNIQWSSTNISQIKIEYTTNNGSNWIVIANNITASLNNFSWTVENTPSNSAKIRISDASNSTRTATSPQVFTIQGPSVTVLSPNGGESYGATNVVNITWSSTNIQNVKIEFSSNGGTTWTNVVSSVAASLGSFAWTIPNITSSNCRVRISDVSNSTITDNSNTSFSITGLPFNILYPNGNEAFQFGESINILWEANGISNINLEFSSNNGLNWSFIATGLIAANGSYTWVIPNVGSSQCLIRMTDVSNPSKLDVSNSVFSIRRLNLLSPGNNEEIFAGNTYNVTWEAFGVENLNITFYGSTTYTVATNIPAGQPFFNWLVPNQTQNNAIVRIASSTDPTYYSEKTIKIIAPILNLTYPTGGEYLQVGKNTKIKWTQSNVSTLDIQYSTNGSNWVYIAQGVNANLGEYTWNIPLPTTSTAKVRLIDANNNLVSSESNDFTITTEFVSVLSPNGGERLTPGESTNIRWSAPTATNVSLKYSTDNGTNWIVIQASIPASPALYSWTIPNIPSSEVLIKVEDAAKPGIFDDSDNLFTIRGIRLINPSGNEVLVAGQNFSIQWKSILVNNIRIQYSSNSGNDWSNLVASYPASLGFYSWQIPNNPTSQGRIRIIDLDNTALRDSNLATFTTTGILLTNPKAGDKWLMKTNKNITWNSAIVDNVKIEYTTNNTNWITIDSYVDASTGSYSWNVPENPSTTSRIRITDLDNPTNTSTTDLFEIQGNGIEVIFPNGGESFESSTTITLQWVSAYVSKQKLEFSDNGGVNWYLIADSLDGSISSYQWVTPQISSTDFLIRITDIENPNINDRSNSTFRVADASAFGLPSTWSVTTQTGENAVIVIPSSVTPKINDVNVEIGDVIGVFFNRNGQLICGGSAIYSGSAMGITVWGDNIKTTIKDGFNNGETYIFRIWDASEGIEYPANASFSAGPGAYRNDTISVISAINSRKTLTIPMRKGVFNLISSYLVPESTVFANVLSAIKNNIDIGKSEAGRIYIPSENIDEIVTWATPQAYEFYMKNNDTLRINGVPMASNGYSFTFLANRWYFVSYLLANPHPVATAITNAWNLTLIKDGEGLVYYPQFNINQIGNMVPGKGYKVVSRGAANARYNSAFTELNNINNPNPNTIEEKTPTNVHYLTVPYATGSSSILVIENNEFKDGDEIAVVGNDNIIFGSAVVVNNKAVVVAWGDDISTSDIDGFNFNEDIKILHWNHKTHKETQMYITEVLNVLSSDVRDNNLKYFKDDVAFVKTDFSFNSIDAPQNSDNISTFPNPTDDYLIINSFDNINQVEIIDIMGRNLITQEVNSKHLKLETSNLSSGIYTAIININGDIKRKKIIIKR